MRIPYFQVDAFTNNVFGGNPAGVCVLERWLPDETLQRIAAENNLSETAFFTPPDSGKFHLRWFTPTTEVDLCGHATLATTFVLLTELGHSESPVKFQTRSGDLTASRLGETVELVTTVGQITIGR
jgi:PhzF family phenazine biosynthesis protein